MISSYFSVFSEARVTFEKNIRKFISNKWFLQSLSRCIWGTTFFNYIVRNLWAWNFRAKLFEV